MPYYLLQEIKSAKPNKFEQYTTLCTILPSIANAIIK